MVLSNFEFRLVFLVTCIISCIQLRSMKVDWMYERGDEAPLHFLCEEHNGVSSILIPERPDPRPIRHVMKALTAKDGKSLDPETSNYLEHECPITSQLELFMGNDTFWILETRCINGVCKAMGGDEFYITYTGPDLQQAVAFTTDRGDGSYELDFYRVPWQNASLLPNSVTIDVQYSCGIGHLAPPRKFRWKAPGAILTTYSIRVDHAPLIHEFQPPNSDFAIDLHSFGIVHAFGGADMEQFVGQNQQHGFHSNIYFHKLTDKALTTKTVSFFVKEIQSSIVQSLKKLKRGKRLALLIGSASWDLLAHDIGQGAGLDNHRKALRQLIEKLQKQNLNKKMEIFWKSPAAVHIQQVKPGHEDVLYMSSSRVYDIYLCQKEVMKQLHVQFLDVYNATYVSASSLTLTGDGRQFRPEMNRFMLNWFYKNNQHLGIA